MIVKNEEDVLERCLDSLDGIAEELIIVDTGSSDNTKAIAAKYTDQIYDFKWIDDFAAARNYSFSKATMDYIYCPDADEVLDEENRKKFFALKKTLLPEIEIVQMFYEGQLNHGTVYNYDKELRPKLFKRLRTFRWINPIHESVDLNPLVYDSDIVISHRPLSLHANRDIDIFEKMIRRGQRLSSKLRTFYAKELLLYGNESNFENAIPVYKEIWESSESSLDDKSEALIILCASARRTNNISDFFKYTLKASGLNLEISEIYCELGAYYETIGDYNEAHLWYYNAAFTSSAELIVSYKDHLPLKGLIRCCTKLGHENLAEEYNAELKRRAN